MRKIKWLLLLATGVMSAQKPFAETELNALLKANAAGVEISVKDSVLTFNGTLRHLLEFAVGIEKTTAPPEPKPVSGAIDLKRPIVFRQTYYEQTKTGTITMICRGQTVTLGRETNRFEIGLSGISADDFRRAASTLKSYRKWYSK